MKVAVFHGASRPIEIGDLPDEELRPEDIRIEVKRCGICGSDISMTSGSAFDYPQNSVLGHEYAGEIIETGKDVTALRVGQRVAVLPNAFCGECENCRTGRPLFCLHGTSLFGGFGERKILPASAAFLMPMDMSFGDGALVEPMACGRRAMRMAALGKGESVLVIGAGSIALSVIFWARRLGAGRIAVLSRSARRDEIALAMGADRILRLDDATAASEELAWFGPPDIVAECVGKPGMLQLAIDRARLGGRVLSMGMCGVPDPLVPVLATFREVVLHFPLGYSPDDFVATIRAFDAGQVRPEQMVGETVGLDALPALFDEMRGQHDHLKVHVDPQIPSQGM
ncbi:MAG: alcohol dehydrogenase catalytic domain-containing protein [Novosphingobium sp.]